MPGYMYIYPYIVVKKEFIVIYLGIYCGAFLVPL